MKYLLAKLNEKLDEIKHLQETDELDYCKKRLSILYPIREDVKKILTNYSRNLSKQFIKENRYCHAYYQEDSCDVFSAYEYLGIKKSLKNYIKLSKNLKQQIYFYQNCISTLQDIERKSE